MVLLFCTDFVFQPQIYEQNPKTNRSIEFFTKKCFRDIFISQGPTAPSGGRNGIFVENRYLCPD